MSIDTFVKKAKQETKTKKPGPAIEMHEEIEYEEHEVKVKYHYIYQHNLTEFENAALKMLSYPPQVFPLSLKTIQGYHFSGMDLADAKHIMGGLVKKLGDKIKHFESWNHWNEDFYELTCDKSEFQNKNNKKKEVEIK